MHHTPSGGAAGRAVAFPAVDDALDVADRAWLAGRGEHPPGRIEGDVAAPTGRRRELRHRVGEIGDDFAPLPDVEQVADAEQLTDGDRERGGIVRPGWATRRGRGRNAPPSPRRPAPHHDR